MNENISFFKLYYDNVHNHVTKNASVSRYIIYL